MIMYYGVWKSAYDNPLVSLTSVALLNYLKLSLYISTLSYKKVDDKIFLECSCLGPSFVFVSFTGYVMVFLKNET